VRDALRESIEASPATQSAGYPCGSVVLCVSCNKPLFVLAAPIGIGERAGRTAWKLSPVRPKDLRTLVERDDVHPGLRAWIKSQAHTQLMTYCDLIPQPRAGDPCLCPQCGHVWVEGRTAGIDDTTDRAFTLELHVIPPNCAPGPTTRTSRRSSPFTR
jgi:hypothetical protein